MYYTQNQMAFGLEMAKDICALGWCTVLYTVLLTCTPSYIFDVGNFPPSWELKSIHSFSKMFCLHSKHSPGFFRLKEMTIYRFLWGRKPQGPKNKNKHLPCCCTITPKCMLMICLSQSIKLSRQNQRFTTQKYWCIEPMRCCHAVLPHVLVWRTIG